MTGASSGLGRHFAVTLAGAAAIGLSVGLLLAHVNRTLTRGGGSLAQIRLSRSGLTAMFGSLSVPLVIGLGENSGLGWQVAFVVAVALIAVGFLTVWSAFLASGTMAVAYIQFHWKFAFDASFFPVVNRGELAVVYAFLFLYIACRGAGRASIDGRNRPSSTAT